MRLTIFWRVIFAQLTLIALLLGMSLYALCQLQYLAGLSSDLLDTDAKSIEAEKHLQKIFLSQRRIAEKYLAGDKGVAARDPEDHRAGEKGGGAHCQSETPARGFLHLGSLSLVAE